MARLSAAQISDSFQKISEVSLERLVGFAVVAYFCGWHYVNAYFSYFSVNRSSFSFGDYTVFIYLFFVLVNAPDVLYEGTWGAVRDAWNAVRDEGVWGAVCKMRVSAAAIGVVFLIAMLLVSALRFGRRIPAGADLARRIVLVVLGVGFLRGFSIASADMDARAVASGNARIADITLTPDFYRELTAQRSKEDVDEYKSRLQQDNKCRALAVLWRNDHETLVLRLEPEIAENHGKATHVYRFPDRSIAFISTLVQDPSETRSRSETESQEC